MSKTVLVYHSTFSIQRNVIFDSVAVSLISKNELTIKYYTHTITICLIYAKKPEFTSSMIMMHI
jgi:hypothetical protein